MNMTALATCTTLRAPLLQTLQFVYYHLNIGVDHMYLFFDDPSDPAIEALQNKTRVSCVRCDEAHWKSLGHDRRSLLITDAQRLNSSIAIQQARSSYDWLIHIDSDELLYYEGDIIKNFDDIPANVQAVKFHTLEAVPTSDIASPFFEEIHQFKVCYIRYSRIVFNISFVDFVRHKLHKIIYRFKILFALLLGCRSVVSPYGYIKGHTNGKTAVRLTAPVQSMECHYPVLENGFALNVRLFSSLYILHYDAPNYNDWEKKWTQRYLRNDKDQHKMIEEFRRLKESVSRQRQFLEFVRRLEQDKSRLPELYQSLYLISERQSRILRKLNLLREVSINKSRFSS